MFALALASIAYAEEDAAPNAAPAPYVQTQDIPYGQVDGIVLPMDTFVPTGKPNGLGIIHVASGAWFSDRGKIMQYESKPKGFTTYCSRGYTVFSIRPGSRTRYTLTEMLAHVDMGIRYVKANAKKYGIDPNRLGITGTSAGAHLSCLAAVSPEKANSESKDANVKQFDTTVKAVGVFFPPTNFLMWGEKPADYVRLQNLFFRDDIKHHTQEEIEAEARKVSPALVAKAPLPPFLIIHGDSDQTVPLQQSKVMVDAVKAAGGDAELIVKPGADHGWATMSEEVKIMADWFDKHL